MNIHYLGAFYFTFLFTFEIILRDVTKGKKMKNSKEYVYNKGKKYGKYHNNYTSVYLWWMQLVCKTGKFEIENEQLLDDNAFLGFWHGDSYCMQFVLRQIAMTHDNVRVIVTSSPRGNSIEDMVDYNGGKAVRLPNGLEMRKLYSELLSIAHEDKVVLGVALDGPEGPQEDPKKLIFLMANKAGKKVVCVHFKFKRCLVVKRRWDKFRIPLPFGKITATFQDMGVITDAKLKDFANLKNDIIKTEY